MPSPGFVYLVGAGPGDPRLLTLRAAELLRHADVVAHDELISPAILALIPPQTELLSVGRRYGQGKTSYRLHPAVLERARQGRVVVRLKCGDPMIFGRGAEEAEELEAAGIPYEIVPGVSAALGAASFAGIPLTDRRFSSQVTLATGHRRKADQALPKGTLVLYMAANRLAESLAELVDSGVSPATPAAYVASATRPSQRVVVGTVANLASIVGPEPTLTPALMIIGEVVKLHERIGWFARQVLAGKRILVARAPPGTITDRG